MKNTIRSSALALTALGMLALAGCANRPPSAELVAARTAYEDARRGPAARLAPDRLLAARQALAKAEAEHADDPQSAEEKHFAYLAERVAMIAQAHGRIALNQREGMLAAQEHDRLQEERRRLAESQLASSNAALSSEREARQKAESALRTALRSLEEIAMIKEETRGLVITLNGAVLFATDKSELLPTARTRLDEVAAALKDLEPGQTIVVEGHTDSTGNDDYNMRLSQSRAQSVHDYLVSRGVPDEVISAVGKGESTPLTENATPEGRANNRRVEIVISHGDSNTVGSSAPGSRSAR